MLQWQKAQVLSKEVNVSADSFRRSAAAELRSRLALDSNFMKDIGDFALLSGIYSTCQSGQRWACFQRLSMWTPMALNPLKNDSVNVCRHTAAGSVQESADEEPFFFDGEGRSITGTRTKSNATRYFPAARHINCGSHRTIPLHRLLRPTAGPALQDVGFVLHSNGGGSRILAFTPSSGAASLTVKWEEKIAADLCPTM